MSHQNDCTYYSRRIDEEMALGDLAVDPNIAALHYEFAHRYALLAAGANVQPRKLTPWRYVPDETIVSKTAQRSAGPL